MVARPLQAAADHASGITGFLFLATGFVVQALPSFGVNPADKSGAAKIAAAVGLAGGAIAAWLIYEVLRVGLFRGEKAYAARSYQEYKNRLRFKPGIDTSGRCMVPRLWQAERVEPD